MGGPATQNSSFAGTAAGGAAQVGIRRKWIQYRIALRTRIVRIRRPDPDAGNDRCANEMRWRFGYALYEYIKSSLPKTANAGATHRDRIGGSIFV